MIHTESLSSLSEEDNEEFFNEAIKDFQNLKPFDFEPEYLEEEESLLQKQETPTKATKVSRVGKNDWCVCGSCKAMQIEAESLCCRDTNEIPEDFFEG